MSRAPCALLILLAIWSPTASGAMQLDPCSAAKFQMVDNPERAIASQPRYKDFPYYAKVRFALGDSSMNYMQELHAPTVVVPAVDGTPILPFAKREPFTQGVAVFGHFAIEGNATKYRAPKLTDGNYLMYDMDVYRQKAYRELRGEYERQKLPPQTWDFIEVQEFSLAESRKAEVAIVFEGKLVAYARVYNATTNDRLLEGNFETGIPKDKRRSELSGLNIPQGSWEFHVSPAERLAHALNLENPYAALRGQFPDMAFVEVGRMFIKRDLEASEHQRIKQLLWTSTLDVVKQMAGGDLANAIMLASGGPFGARYYPKQYNWHPIAEKQIANWEDLQLRAAPGGESGVATIFSPNPKRTMDMSSVDPASVKPVTFFATSGKELEKALIDQSLLLSNYPTTYKMVSSIESEPLPWVKPLINERYPTLN